MARPGNTQREGDGHAAPTGGTIAALRAGVASVDRRAAFALAYTALVLVLEEYLFIPRAVTRNGWFAGVTALPTGMTSGLVWVASTIVFFVLIPAMVVRRVHREPLATIGWSGRGFVRHAPLYVGLYLAVLPLIVLASTRADFARTYPFMAAARTSIPTFIAWEGAYVLSFFALEAFFRGYLLFTCEARMGWTALFVMVVPYAMIHFHKPLPEALAAIGAGLALGALALALRSFWGGVVVHALVAVTMDLLAVHRTGLF